MRKRVLSLALLAFVMVLFVRTAEAEVLSGCDLTVTLLNQDPYPAAPEDYVKVVFKIEGLQNPNCKGVIFELKPDFPFSIDPDVLPRVDLSGGTHVNDYESFALIPFKLRVDKDAIDGDNTIKVSLEYEDEKGQMTSQVEELTINVAGVRADFEVSIDDFDPATNTLTLAVLNMGENDVKALVIEIPKQESISVKGSNRDIVGDLDSNDDTTARFEALPKEGEFEVTLHYTDEINERRAMVKKVMYDSSYFLNRKADEAQSISLWFYVTLILVVVWVIIWIRRRMKNNRLKNSMKDHRK